MNVQNSVNQQTHLNPMLLHLPESVQWRDEQFFDFCQANRDLRIERTAQGDCEIMAPTGGETGWRNSALVAQLYHWADNDGSGVVFDSSSGFILPNGAIRSPDASWVKKSRLATLTAQQKQRFLPLCPDFVVELRSHSDSLKTLQDKMHEYMANGSSLGWLIDPKNRHVFIFHAGKAAITIDNPELLSGSELLSGFELNLQKLWTVAF